MHVVGTLGGHFLQGILARKMSQYELENVINS